MSQGNAVGNLETILRTATGGESFDRSKLVLRSFFAENEQESRLYRAEGRFCAPLEPLRRGLQRNRTEREGTARNMTSNKSKR